MSATIWLLSLIFTQESTHTPPLRTRAKVPKVVFLALERLVEIGPRGPQ
jgi:hypothetical protein